jgi:hypothetical protein
MFGHAKARRHDEAVPTPIFVIPAKAGTQSHLLARESQLGSRFRGNDEWGGKREIFALAPLRLCVQSANMDSGPQFRQCPLP